MSDEGEAALTAVAAAMIGISVASVGFVAYLYSDAKSRSREAARVFNTKRYASEEEDKVINDEVLQATAPAVMAPPLPPPVVPRESPLNRSEWLDLQGVRALVADLDIVDRDFREMPVNAISELEGMVDEKNRYTNILPNAHSRVMLSGSSPEETYINANWVKGFSREREYILTQGPMQNTILDFWRMVWETNARNIVMITKLMEDDRVKCEKYFADRDQKYKIGDFLLAWTNTDVHPHFKLTTMKLGRVDSKETRVIRHFWYDSWPDHGVPEATDSVISFVHAIEEAKRQAEKEANGEVPTLVHCSAGVGRTGVFVACDVALQQVEAYRKVDPTGVLAHLRRARGGCIQTPAQYLYFILVARDYLVRLAQFEKE